MNKLPTKQIYLLLIIIIGILALSVYSTYSIFTLEGETSDIVNFKTLNSLDVSSEMYEYKQVVIPKNSYLKTDVDVYNSSTEEVCYSVWYKVTTKDSQEKVNVYQYTIEGLTATGTLGSLESRRATLVLTNDNDKDVKVNFGVSSGYKSDTCKLNISSDKNLISLTIGSIDKLSEKLQKEDKYENEDGYLLYEDLDKEIELDKIITISEEYDLKDEIFTLKSYEEIDLSKDKIEDDKEYYTCLDNISCQTLYKIKEIKVDDDKYILVKYDKLFSYSKGESGIRKVDNNYIYYGDNPNNFIYYNCQNNDTSSCELWRILGIYYDSEEERYVTKIIRNESILLSKFDDKSSSWLNSSLDKYLNSEYKINDDFSYMYLEKNEYVKDNEISYETKSNDSIIRIMKLTDYLNSSICTNIDISNYQDNCLKENWLNNYQLEWTQTYHYLEIDEEVINNKVFVVGNEINSYEIDEEFNIRPVIYLTDRVFLYDGDGSITNPYVIR